MGDAHFGQFFWGLKIRGRQQRDVVAFRCVGCGYLEFFAPEVGDAPDLSGP